MESDTILSNHLLTNSSHSVDKLDYKILNLMTQDDDNKTIAEKLKVPLSTIQRRTRILIKKEYAKQIRRLNYKKLGLNKGLIHIYLGSGNMRKMAEELLSNDGIVSAGVHVGNSDIVGEFVYEDSEQLVDLISRVKHMDEVEKVVWSEEVYLLAGRQESILAVINRIIDRQ